MAVEPKRGCGYRKVGGLYLVSGGAGVPCDRLPIRLDVCPVCSHGFKQSRGWTWVDLAGLLGRGMHRDCTETVYRPCILCDEPERVGKAGLLWIGEKFYKTPADFEREGVQMGLSRRISAIPRNFKVGETWVLLAHSKTIREYEEVEVDVPDEALTPEGPTKAIEQREKWIPGIFTLWKPSRIEKICKESERGSEAISKLLEQGITPVFVPDDDKDHAGTVYDKDQEEETETTWQPGLKTVA